jgi:membrane dipeptidase
MGREVIAEMNRLGMVIDMSHLGEKSTLQAIALSSRPIAITHANPFEWTPVKRNKSEVVLQALAPSRGLLGLRTAASGPHDDWGADYGGAAAPA